jgi:AcrR family transcriptional regulator
VHVPIDDGPRSRRKKPVQERGRATVEIILEATDRIAEELGVDGIRMAHVAKRAGVSEGTLYEYFPNVYALTAAWENRCYARYATEALKRIARMQETVPPFEDCIREMAGFGLDMFEEQFRKYRYPTKVDALPPLKDRVDVTEGLVAAVAGALGGAPDRDTLRSNDWTTMARVVVKLILHLGHDRAVFPLAGEAQEAYRAAIVDAVVLFMLGKNARALGERAPSSLGPP